MDEFVCQLEKEAYYYVLRAFRIQSKDLSWEKEAVLTNLREELRISNDVHRELLRTLTSDETLNHLNNFNRTEPPRNMYK
ncbi:unnamed protein product [Sphenostylis stenocarpa]|uniref:ENT domain-containing protein n=1 Tax=Sphenostylis stenocarpa TaxID=92480 RepID=A0AA86S517_9FABA|nr:unnamed protein product [Sphenostylis stenocarpa]